MAVLTVIVDRRTKYFSGVNEACTIELQMSIQRDISGLRVFIAWVQNGADSIRSEAAIHQLRYIVI